MGENTSPSVPRSLRGQSCSTFPVLKGRCPVPLLKVKPNRPRSNLETEFFGVLPHRYPLAQIMGGITSPLVVESWRF